MANIEAKRDEILRLIDKVSKGSGSPTAAPKRIHKGKTSKSSRVGRQLKELGKIKKRRKQLEDGLIGDGPLDLYRLLEKRIEALEKLVQPGSAKQAAPKQPQKEQPPISIETSNHTLGGAIQEGLLADILQLVSSNMMTGVMTVQDSDSTFMLYYREGEIFHAQGSDLAGESAFFASMAMDEGKFFFTETSELPEEVTIQSQTQFLILEALRQIDEARAQESA
jgi:hypothetical protein